MTNSLTVVIFKSYSHFSAKKKKNVFAIFQDRNFNITLANNFVTFEQLGPDCFHY